MAFLKRVLGRVNHVHVKDVSKSLADAARGKDTGIGISHSAIGDGVNADNIRQVMSPAAGFRLFGGARPGMRRPGRTAHREVPGLGAGSHEGARHPGRALKLPARKDLIPSAECPAPRPEAARHP